MTDIHPRLIERSERSFASEKGAWLAILWPAAMLIGFFAVPFLLLLRASFANVDPTLYQGSGFTLSAYAGLATPLVFDTIASTFLMALIVSAAALAIAVPATWLIARMRRRAQVAWLIGLLSTLALSEVLVTFAWQILLSRRAGVSNVLVWLGFLEEPVSLAPSFLGVVAAIVYFVIPLAILTLFPAMSRLDPSLVEAARMLGARPLRAFLGIALPLLRGPIVTAFTMSMVIALGSYVAPLVLGGPANWTIGVVISETALQGQNLPLASAMAVLLLVIAGALLLLSNRLGGRMEP
jgi:putative spermidine/putrescine transport system permease protein